MRVKMTGYLRRGQMRCQWVGEYSGYDVRAHAEMAAQRARDAGYTIIMKKLPRTPANPPQWYLYTPDDREEVQQAIFPGGE